MPKAKRKSKKPAKKRKAPTAKPTQNLRFYQPEGAPLARLQQQFSDGAWADVPNVVGPPEQAPEPVPEDHP